MRLYVIIARWLWVGLQFQLYVSFRRKPFPPDCEVMSFPPDFLFTIYKVVMNWGCKEWAGVVSDIIICRLYFQQEFQLTLVALCKVVGIKKKILLIFKADISWRINGLVSHPVKEYGAWRLHGWSRMPC